MSVDITIRFEDSSDADEFLRRFEHREIALRASIVGESGDGVDVPAPEPPSYHNLFITTKELKRTSIFNLPFGWEVSCNRVAGWEVWQTNSGQQPTFIAGEYTGKKRGLRLDVGGHVIVDSLTKKEKRG